MAADNAPVLIGPVKVVTKQYRPRENWYQRLGYLLLAALFLGCSSIADAQPPTTTTFAPVDLDAQLVVDTTVASVDLVAQLVGDTTLEQSAQLDEELQQKTQMVTQSLGNLFNAEDFTFDLSELSFTRMSSRASVFLTLLALVASTLK